MRLAARSRHSLSVPNVSRPGTTPARRKAHPIWVVIASLLIAGIFWNGGELHRQNCERDGKVGCSVLPWVAGHYPRSSQSGPITIPDWSKVRIPAVP